jgi:hypothetical protein
MGFLSKLFKRKPRTERVRVSLESVRIANDRMMARKRPPQQHHTGCSIAAEGGERCQRGACIRGTCVRCNHRWRGGKEKWLTK